LLTVAVEVAILLTPKALAFPEGFSDSRFSEK